ncbi:hypothetical protein QQX98_012048 [Neonectria punicea]|uniref:DNA2/NAM7 helicase-like C-terminal domain-containing protein n=1 Tax=Neonectria punicea TaxID=979145 RepID=A0ABR1GKD3_9HYPO
MERLDDTLATQTEPPEGLQHQCPTDETTPLDTEPESKPLDEQNTTSEAALFMAFPLLDVDALVEEPNEHPAELSLSIAFPLLDVEADDRVGQLGGRDTKTFGMSRQPYARTGWFHALVDIDGILLPGFAPETVARLDLGPFQGLHIRVNICLGEFVQPVIHLQFVIRHGDMDKFADLIIPLATTLDHLSIADLDSADPKSIAPLLTFNQIDVSESQPSTTAVDRFAEALAGDMADPARAITQVTDTVRRLRADESHPQATRDIVDAVIAKLQGTVPAAISIWFFPEESFASTWRHNLTNIQAFTQPYAHILQNVRTDCSDLTFDNLELDDIVKPERPVPPTTVFLDDAHRTVTLMAGTVEEICMEDQRAAALFEATLSAVVIDDPFSKWKPQDDDLQVYGVPADGQALNQYLVLHAADIADTLPDIGSSCYFHLQAPVATRVIPRVALTAGQITRITRDLAREFPQTRGDDAGVEYFEEKLLTVGNERFITYTAGVIFNLLKEPSAEAVQALPDQPAGVQLAATAESFAETLQQQSQESDEQWYLRLQNWVRNIGVASPGQAPTGLGAAWLAVRAARFWQYSLNFHSEVPVRRLLQEFPRLREDLENGNFTGESRGVAPSLDTAPAGYAFVTGGPGAGKTTVAVQIVKPIIAVPRSYPALEPDSVDATPGSLDNSAAMRTSTSNNESTAVPDGESTEVPDGESTEVPDGESTNASNQLADVWATASGGLDWTTASNAQDWTTTSNTQDWTTTSNTQGWTTAPTPQEANEPWEGAAIDPTGAAHDVPADATQWGEPATYGVFATAPAVPSGWNQTETQSAVQPTGPNATPKVAWTAGQNKLVDDAIRRLAQACPDKIVRRILPWKTERADMLIVERRQPRVIDTTQAPLAGSQDRTLAKHINSQFTTSFLEKSPSSVFQTVSQFAKEIAEQHPDEWTAYRRAVFEKTHDPDAFVLNRTEHIAAVQALLEYAVGRCDIICGTPVALAQLADHVNEWNADFIVVDEAARMSEPLSLMVPSKYQDAACLFIGDTKQFAPLTLTTGQSDYKTIFGPQRGVSLFHRVEDMGRLTFTLRLNHRAWGMAAEWAQGFFYGKQMSIVNRGRNSATSNIRQWITRQTGARSTTVMFKIPEATENPVGTSYANDANALFVMQLVVQMYREMNPLNVRDVAACRRGEEVRVRRGSIMILTPYSVQKNQYQLLLRQMSAAEYPTDLVEVRTIDDSPSHEADIVLIDLVRTAKLGFIGDPRRMDVMMTRARLATFIIGTDENMRGSAPFKDLLTWLEAREAVVSMGTAKSRPQWTMFCKRCIQPGHIELHCTVALACSFCDGASHATRNCPVAGNNAVSVYVEERIMADDGVQRNALIRTGIGKQEGKRVKKRKAGRADARKPPTAETDSHSAYKSAARQLHESSNVENE